MDDSDPKDVYRQASTRRSSHGIGIYASPSPMSTDSSSGEEEMRNFMTDLLFLLELS